MRRERIIQSFDNFGPCPRIRLTRSSLPTSLLPLCGERCNKKKDTRKKKKKKDKKKDKGQETSCLETAAYGTRWREKVKRGVERRKDAPDGPTRGIPLRRA